MKEVTVESSRVAEVASQLASQLNGNQMLLRDREGIAILPRGVRPEQTQIPKALAVVLAG